MTLHTTNMMKLKFVRNKAILRITNTNDVVVFDRQDMIGIHDIRSLGYSKSSQTCYRSILVNSIISNWQKTFVTNSTDLSTY